MPKSIAMFVLAMLSLGSPAPLLLGCDGSDGIELLLAAKAPDTATDEAMESVREIIERRISALGSAGATVVRQGPNRILVRLARRGDAEMVKSLVGRPGRLEFRLVDASVTEAQIQSGRALIGSQILPFPDGGPGGRIAVQRHAIIAGRMIVDARPDFDEQGRPSVTVRFDGTGTRRFARATQENIGRRFAIILDNVVISAPVILEPILGGHAQISGSFTTEATNQLAISLRSGPLPIRLVVIEERVLTR
jgi:preprotein translocase subunit SecD